VLLALAVDSPAPSRHVHHAAQRAHERHPVPTLIAPSPHPAPATHCTSNARPASQRSPASNPRPHSTAPLPPSPPADSRPVVNNTGVGEPTRDIRREMTCATPRRTRRSAQRRRIAAAMHVCKAILSRTSLPAHRPASSRRSRATPHQSGCSPTRTTASVCNTVKPSSAARSTRQMERTRHLTQRARSTCSLGWALIHLKAPLPPLMHSAGRRRLARHPSFPAACA